MADNTTLNTMTGGDVIASDDAAGVKYQQVKLVDGTLNSTTPIPGDAGGLHVVVTEIAAGNNNIGNVDIVTMPSVDVNVSSMAALVAGTANIGDVDVASIAAGDNNIGNVDIVTMPSVTIGAAIPAGNNNIGDVDINAVATSAGGLGKVTDAVAGASDVGVAALVVRDDALSTLTPIDGDYVPLRTDSTGALWVHEGAALPAGTNNIGDVDVLTLPNVTIGTMAALVAGSAAIGKLAANSGVDIGDVDVTSLPATPTGTNKIGYIGEAPGATVVTAQVTPTASAATLVASRATRTRLTLYNGTNMTVFVGPATVSAANGFAMPPGAGMELDTTALLQNIVATVTGLTGVVYVLETAA